MSYVKWVGNSIPGDGTSRFVLGDDLEVVRGVPVQLSTDDQKKLEGQGVVFEASSAEEAKAVAEAAEQTPGADVAGSAPVFVDTQGEFNQDTTNDEPSSGKSNK